MSKLSREQMRVYQRDRRKRLEKDKDCKVHAVHSLTGVGLELRVLTLEHAVVQLQAEVQELQGKVALLEVVEETVRGIPARRGSSVGVVSDKTLFQRVVDEKERRVRG